MTPNAGVVVEGLVVSRGGKDVLDGVTVRFLAGQLTAVVGPNGAGKSTLFLAILDSIPVRQGRISVGGDASPGRAHRIAWVPQRNAVDWDFPITVRDVVRQGRWPARRWWQRLTKADHALVDDAMEQVGLTQLADRLIGDLSGGQQQRAFLARALARDCEVLLLDEPFAGLDAPSEARMLSVLRDQASRGRTVVVVHHDLNTVRTRFDQVLLLAGRVIAEGAPSSVLTPASLLRAYGITAEAWATTAPADAL